MLPIFFRPVQPILAAESVRLFCFGYEQSFSIVTEIWLQGSQIGAEPLLGWQTYQQG
jgi:hypothetical protein